MNVGIYAASEANGQASVESCLDWQNPTGCPHTTQPDRDANHITRLFDLAGGTSHSVRRRIVQQALDMAATEARSRQSLAAVMVGEFRAVT